MSGRSGRPGSGRSGNRGAGTGRPGGGRSVPARSAGSAGSSGSLYERYKDALRRGHVASLRSRNEAAIDAYGEAASIAPDRALPHASIGGIFVKMGRLDEAITAYDRALELGPRDEAALRGIAEAFARAGRRTEAAGALDRLAEILDGAGRLADACDAARRALELAESRVRRRQVETFAARLRKASPGDEAAQRALDQALRMLEPAPPAKAETVEPAKHETVEPARVEAETVDAPAVEPEAEAPHDVAIAAGTEPEAGEQQMPAEAEVGAAADADAIADLVRQWDSSRHAPEQSARQVGALQAAVDRARARLEEVRGSDLAGMMEQAMVAAAGGADLLAEWRAASEAALAAVEAETVDAPAVEPEAEAPLEVAIAAGTEPEAGEQQMPAEAEVG
ncbi:MAG: hypothetical protein QOI09_665, partial [Chloroflexota bacterium]|nr:hypothetical protein [Chloroflexota bacterium]